MSKPTKQQLQESPIGSIFTWITTKTNKIEVKEYVYLANGIEYVRSNDKGRESGLEIMCKDLGIS